MAARLNVALVGAGLMASFHAETLSHRLPNARLAVIADADEAKTRQLIERLGMDDTRYERDAQAASSAPAGCGTWVRRREGLCGGVDDAEGVGRDAARGSNSGGVFRLYSTRNLETTLWPIT